MVTYYVDAVNGSDGYPGTQIQPWATITKAAETLQAGDQVFIRTGIYEEQVVPVNNGVSNAPILYSAYPGETPIINGLNLADVIPGEWWGLFQLEGRSYIVVDGIRFEWAPGFGIILINTTEPCNHMTVENCQFYDMAKSAMRVGASQGTKPSYIKCLTNYLDRINTSWYGTPSQEAISFSRTDNFEIAYNIYRNCHKIGIDAKSGCSNGIIHHNTGYGMLSPYYPPLIYCDAYSNIGEQKNIYIYKNLLFCDGESNGIALATEMGGTLENIWVCNNICVGNGSQFAIWKGTETGNHHKKDIYIINNTFIQRPDTHPAIQLTDYLNRWENLVIRNNIIFAGHNSGINITHIDQREPGQLIMDHNLFSSTHYLQELVYGTDYIIVDPMFIDDANDDFHIQNVSPARDSGSFVDAPTDDFDGVSRPVGSDIDRGAFEYYLPSPEPPWLIYGALGVIAVAAIGIFILKRKG